MLQRLHPHDRRQREREGERENPPRRVEPHLVGAPGRAVLILLERPVPQPRGEQPPDAEADHRRQVEPRLGEQRPLRRQRMVVRGIAGSSRGRSSAPAARWAGRTAPSRGTARQARCSQKRRMRHRPARVEQMMHQHQEQRAQHQAQEEHERQQPGIAELLQIQQRAEQAEHQAAADQQAGHLAPPGEIQRRQAARIGKCAHSLFLQSPAQRLRAHRPASPAGSAAARADRR